MTPILGFGGGMAGLPPPLDPPVRIMGKLLWWNCSEFYLLK